ncbi:MAG: amidohydrolase family protein, partial [Planctomycetota bacterium]
MMLAKSTTLTLIALVAVGVMSSPAKADPDSFALRARRILPVSPDLPWVIANGVIVVREGRVVAVGTDVEIPPDLPTIEFPDGTVIPGLVAAASNLVGERPRGGTAMFISGGFVIMSSGGGQAGDKSIAAGYRAVDGFDRYENYARTLAAGVTSVHLNPGSHRLLTGQGAVAKLGGPPPGRVVRPRADLTVNLGPDVNDPPADVTYPFPASADVAITPGRRQRPGSRMGQFLALEEAVCDALAGKRGEQFSIHGPALARAWKDRLPLRIRADRTGDLLGGIKFLRQQQRAGYFVGGAEVDRVADAIRGANVPLVYQPRNRFRAPGGDIGRDPAALGAPLCDFEALEGVKVALAPPLGQPVADLRLAAVRASGAGLGPRRALEAITRTAAEILGVADRVGSLAPGKDADLLVLSGDPLEVSSHVQAVYVQGRRVFEPPAGGALVVKAGTIWAAPGKEIRDGQILVENGKIVAVGRSVPHPPFARVIDARPDGFVTPGLIDAHGHLGLHGDRSAASRDMRLSKLVGAADVTDRRVSAAGITTVLMAPYSGSSMGSPSAAIKTSGARRADRVIRDPAAVLFDVGRADPTTVQATLGKSLAAGKKYLDTWKKYEKDLKEFLEAKEKGEKPEAGEESKEEETKEEAGPDPVTGTWEAEARGGPLPMPVTMTIVIQLTGSTVEGRITRSSMGFTGSISGTFDGKHLSAEIAVDMPGVETTATLEADLVEEDHFKGTVTVEGVTAQIEGRRVDKTPVDLK